MIWWYKFSGFIHQHYLAFLLAIGVGFLFYIVAGVLEALIDARYDIKSRKREPMEWCNKHGHFRKQHCLPLFPELGVDVYVCPTCYYDVTFKTPDKRLKDR